jgi:hypothetical protein
MRTLRVQNLSFKPPKKRLPFRSGYLLIQNEKQIENYTSEGLKITFSLLQTKMTISIDKLPVNTALALLIDPHVSRQTLLSKFKSDLVTSDYDSCMVSLEKVSQIAIKYIQFFKSLRLSFKLICSSPFT